MKIAKDRVPTIIRIEGYILEGFCHVVPRQRFSDYLNATKNEFVIMTDVKVYRDKAGTKELVDTLPFLGVNRMSIITIFPKESEAESIEIKPPRVSF